MHSDNPLDLLYGLGQAVAHTESPKGRAEAVLDHVARALDVTGGSIWFLERATAALQPYASFGAGPVPTGHMLPVTRLDRDATEMGPVQQYFSVALRSSATDRREPALPSSGTAIPIVRLGTVVGIIALNYKQPEDLSGQDQLFVRHAADWLVRIYEDRFTATLLRTVQEPLDFELDYDDFFTQLAMQVAHSSQMRYVALREIADNGNALRTIGLDGFGTGVDLSDWDLEPLARYPHFAAAAKGRVVPVNSMDDPGHEELRGRIELRDIQSFVAAPLEVGGTVFGVLSVGAACEFQYGAAELVGFRNLANAAGIAIEYFRSSHAARRQVSEWTRNALAITAIEIVQAARHEAVSHISNASLAVVSEFSAGQVVDELEQLKLQNDLTNAIEALDKMKTAMSPPKVVREETTIAVLWGEARSYVAGSLEDQRITATLSGGDDTPVYVAKDWFREVFNNLLLNSIDAFKGLGRKGNRRISLRVDATASTSDELVLVYVDNAGGIQPQSLTHPVALPDVPVVNLVFEQHVTSKGEGGGHGLWLARRIMSAHGGSIDLIDPRGRGGVTFRLSVPRSGVASRADIQLGQLT